MKATLGLQFNIIFVLIICEQLLAISSSKFLQIDKQLLKDKKHGIRMGKIFLGCDDGKNDLHLDWDENTINYTCYTPNQPLPVKPEIQSKEECETIAPNYYPQHYCMDKSITYNTTLPTFGDHRPLWPKFGEYIYVPPQRWLHNIEHGAIVMLFHPCANKVMVSRLRAIVVHCIRKHVITAYNLIDEERPLALVAWGCRLTMNWVDIKTVVSFIKRKSMKGPEGNYSKQGQYDRYLLDPAKTAPGSDYNDSRICVNL